MKYTVLLTALILFAVQSQAQIIYVKSGANGTGTSWNDALGNLTAALQEAQNGSAIWVGAGTFTPTRSDDRNASFEIKDGVALYGGFAGNEISLKERNLNKNTTILSGEIGTPGKDDNCYNVIYTKNVSATTIIDGFVISDGYASGVGTTGSRLRCGGGWYNDGSTSAKGSNPIIMNCIFENNFARDGAGMYNNGRGGETNPTVFNCEFRNNSADLDGGAIFNDGRRNGISNPVIGKCVFENNEANYGGAIFNYGGAGKSNPTISNCRFVGNEAYIRGGGMYNMDVEGECSPMIQHCQFIENTASVGDSIYKFGNGGNDSEKRILTKNLSL
ncbi:MAG: hypothetical protein GY705_14750 [Bacteroidetes bacterium]|nr:hypothetical protein [Bacteroidota bacterium]